MHSHVGQSERNMDSVINVIKQCAPCVLLIDEAEKTLAGTASSNQTDGGTLMRIVGQLLQFLSSEDSANIFTIMTSNDVSQLPPELTRSGRLDTMWYFGLPNAQERYEIFKIHFGKKPIPLEDDLLNTAALSSNNLTGAEIKECVKIAVRKCFKRYKETGCEKLVTMEDVNAAISEIIPVYISSQEKILALEAYAVNRARFATKKDEQSSGGFLEIPSISSFNSSISSIPTIENDLF